jgi:hypothetical protein
MELGVAMVGDPHHFFLISVSDARASGLGEADVLVQDILCLATSWFEQAAGVSLGEDHEDLPCLAVMGCAQLFVQRDPGKGALMAAAIDLVRLLSRSPQGRQALANFSGKPVSQSSESPGG